MTRYRKDVQKDLVPGQRFYAYLLPILFYYGAAEVASNAVPSGTAVNDVQQTTLNLATCVEKLSRVVLSKAVCMVSVQSECI